jgi:transcriptional regulator with XRE-family HTH domain
MHFGATLQLLRNHAGLSLRGLGLQVGVSAAYLSRVEHGRDAAPTAERVLAIAAALRLPGALLLEILELLGGDAGEWLRATPIGRRLAAELRLRSLSEAQLARVLAFVQREFPLGPEAERRTVRGFH